MCAHLSVLFIYILALQIYCEIDFPEFLIFALSLQRPNEIQRCFLKEFFMGGKFIDESTITDFS